MPFRKLIPPFTLTGCGGGCCSVYKKKVSRTRTYDTRPQQKKLNKITDCFIFLFLFPFITLFASFKEKTIFQNLFSHPHFLIRIFPSHFPIRILSSAFCHPHFIIRHRHPPPSGPHFTETLLPVLFWGIFWNLSLGIKVGALIPQGNIGNCIGDIGEPINL